VCHAFVVFRIVCWACVASFYSAVECYTFPISRAFLPAPQNKGVTSHIAWTSRHTTEWKFSDTRATITTQKLQQLERPPIHSLTFEENRSLSSLIASCSFTCSCFSPLDPSAVLPGRDNLSWKYIILVFQIVCVSVLRMCGLGCNWRESDDKRIVKRDNLILGLEQQ
jgi:hypothetical protein